MTFLYWLAGSLAYVYGGLATARRVYRDTIAERRVVRSDDKFFAGICGFFWPFAWTVWGVSDFVEWFMKRPTRNQKLEKKAAETRKLMAEAQKIADELGLLIPELPMPSAAYVDAGVALMKKEMLTEAEKTRKAVVQRELARRAADVAKYRAELVRRMGFDPGNYPYVGYFTANPDKVPMLEWDTYTRQSADYNYVTRADEARRGSFYDEEEDI